MIEVTVFDDKKPIDRLKTEKETITIGRDPKCDITLPDDYVSGVHAEIAFREDSALVTDKGSTNGTFVNSKKIKKPTVIKEDAVITIERFHIRFRLKAEQGVKYADPGETIVIPSDKKSSGGKKYYI